MTHPNANPATGRPAWAQVLALVLAFLGGGIVGVALSGRLAPDSSLAQFVGLFSFSLPFVVGMNAWLGLAVVIALWRLVTRRSARRAGGAEPKVPPGSFVFVPVSGLLVSLAGLLVGLLGSSLGVFTTFALYVFLGLAYGTGCWLLARSGYLPFPSE